MAIKTFLVIYISNQDRKLQIKKFLIYLFKYGLLKYKFTNDNYDNLKFSKKIYISTLCNTFVKPGNDNEFINEKNIKKLIYFIIEKDIKIESIKRLYSNNLINFDDFFRQLRAQVT